MIFDKSWIKSVISEPHSQKQKSSAYNAEGEVILFGKSLIIKEKSTGLRTLPCGSRFPGVVIDKEDPTN